MIWACLNYLLVLLDANYARKVAPKDGYGPLPQCDSCKENGVADVGEPNREQEDAILTEGGRYSEDKGPSDVDQDTVAVASSLHPCPSPSDAWYDCPSEYFTHHPHKEHESESRGRVIGREGTSCQSPLVGPRPCIMNSVHRRSYDATDRQCRHTRTCTRTRAPPNKP